MARAVTKIHRPQPIGVNTVSTVVQAGDKTAGAPYHQARQNRHHKIIAGAATDATEFLTDFHPYPAAEQAAYHALAGKHGQPKTTGLPVPQQRPHLRILQQRHQLIADARAQQAAYQHHHTAARPRALSPTGTAFQLAVKQKTATKRQPFHSGMEQMGRGGIMNNQAFQHIGFRCGIYACLKKFSS